MFFLFFFSFWVILPLKFLFVYFNLWYAQNNKILNNFQRRLGGFNVNIPFWQNKIKGVNLIYISIRSLKNDLKHMQQLPTDVWSWSWFYLGDHDHDHMIISSWLLFPDGCQCRWRVKHSIGYAIWPSRMIQARWCQDYSVSLRRFGDKLPICACNSSRIRFIIIYFSRRHMCTHKSS